MKRELPIFQTKYLLISFWLLFIFFNFNFSISKKLIEFDSIMYVASALKYEIKDYKSLHRKTYNELKNFVDKNTYKELTTNYLYRESVYKNLNYFLQQLPFYEIRPLYILLVYILYKIGFNIYFSTIFISAVSSSLAIIFLFKSLYSKVHPIFLFILPVILFSFKIQEVSRFSTPDALFFLLSSIILYLFLNNKFKPIFLFIPISVVVRTDTIIFVFIFCITFIIFMRKEYLYPILSMIVSLVTVMIINTVSNNYGWKTIFYFSFINRIPNPAEINPYFTFLDYFTILIKKLAASLQYPPFVLYINNLFLNIILLYFNREFLRSKIIMLLLYVSFFYILLHYLGFPAVWSRFFIGFYIYNTLVTIFMINNIFTKNSKNVYNNIDF